MPVPVPFKRTGFRVGTLPEPLRQAIRDASRRAVIDRAAFEALTDRARIYAFSVAGDLSNRSIQTILRAAMGNIAAGRPFADFKRSLPPGVFTNITAPEVVYRNAAANAYQRGRFNQQARIKQFRPFLMYVTFRDDRVRPNHAIMEGVVSPQGSTFWTINYPPNGHLCRCIARALSRQQVGGKQVFKSQAEVERFKINQQIKAGIPKSKVVKPIADRQFRSALHANEAAAEVFVNAFKTFDRKKWASIFSPIRPPVQALKQIAGKKPVKPDITKFKTADTIEDAKAYTEAIITAGNKSGYLKNPDGTPYRRFWHKGGGSGKEQIEKFFGKALYTDDVSLETLNRINQKLFELKKRAETLGIPSLRGLRLFEGKGPAGSMGDGVLQIKISQFEKKPSVADVSKWKKGSSISPFADVPRPGATRYYFEDEKYGLAIMEHEFGHHIHQSIDKVFVLRKAGTPAENLLSQKKAAFTRKNNKLPADKRENSPSSYATDNGNEWLAENYRLWKLGKKNLVDTPLKDLFKNLDEGKGFIF